MPEPLSLLAALRAWKVASLAAIRLALRTPEGARQYAAESLRRYRELMGLGLPARDPVRFLSRQGWGAVDGTDRLELPASTGNAGGTRPAELLLLATVTRALRPKKIFEIGTYHGQTTSVFILNAPADASILSLDLPAGADPGSGDDRSSDHLGTDLALARERDPGRLVRQLQLESRCEQLLADSLVFDPMPHAGSVELGFIDGAHALPYVRNDTLKMARMMADRGLAFWHDYGGQGSFRHLTTYLETLAQRIPIYRVPDTTLAWASAPDLRRLAEP